MLGVTEVTIPYFSSEIASGVERMNLICCGIPATLVLSSYITSEVWGYCVLVLPGLTFPVPMCTFGDELAGGGVVVIQGGISAPTVSCLRAGPVPRWKLCSRGRTKPDIYAVSSFLSCFCISFCTFKFSLV